MKGVKKMDLIEISSIVPTNIEENQFVTKVKELEGSLYRLAYSILKNVQDSEDAISETILMAYKYRNKLKKQEAFRPWITQILIRESYKLLKKNKRVMKVSLEECHELVKEDGLGGELIEIIKELPDELSIILILFYYEDYTVKEIAKLASLREGTVKSRLYRGRELLKQYILRDKEVESHERF